MVVDWQHLEINTTSLKNLDLSREFMIDNIDTIVTSPVGFQGIFWSFFCVHLHLILLTTCSYVYGVPLGSFQVSLSKVGIYNNPMFSLTIALGKVLVHLQNEDKFLMWSLLGNSLAVCRLSSSRSVLSIGTQESLLVHFSYRFHCLHCHS